MNKQTRIEITRMLSLLPNNGIITGTKTVSDEMEYIKRFKRFTQMGTAYCI